MVHPGKYSLILICDNGSPYKMRVGKRFFLFLMATIVLLPIITSASLWAAWTIYQDKRVWEQEKAHIVSQNDTMRVQIERLKNIEKLVKKTSTDTPVVSNATQRVPEPAPQKTLSANALEQAPLETEEQDRDHTEQDQTVDKDIVFVEGVSTRLQNNNKQVRISFDLRNPRADEGGGPLVGYVLFSLLDADGKKHQLTHSETTFRISRYKKIIANVPVPVEANIENAAAMVQVFVEDAMVFRKIYPIESR